MLIEVIEPYKGLSLLKVNWDTLILNDANLAGVYSELINENEKAQKSSLLNMKFVFENVDLKIGLS